MFLTSSQALSSVITLNSFPQAVVDNFSSVFNIDDDSGLIQHFQEIIDTVEAGVKTMVDEDSKFTPLSNGNMINALGLQELKGM